MPWVAMEHLGKGIKAFGNKINNNEPLFLHSERYPNSFFYLPVKGEKKKKSQNKQEELIFTYNITTEPRIFAVQYAMDFSPTVSREDATSY